LALNLNYQPSSQGSTDYRKLLEQRLTPVQKEIFFENQNYKYRIHPKGRRLGATQGGAIAHIIYMLEGKKCLWGDTINANIDRYVERYFIPEMQKAGLKQDQDFKWRPQKKILYLRDGYVDFRSADNPTTWEGMGYDTVFLNEAGIILDDPYLYYNAVLPMMIDKSDSSLIAAGTPKLSQGIGLLFEELWLKVQAGEPGFYGKRYETSVINNPYLDEESIRTLEAEISPAERPQELGGEFIALGGMGSFFRKDWFNPVAEMAQIIKSVRGWDFAASEVTEMNKDPDWTVGVKLGITNEGKIIIMDVKYLRGNPGAVDKLLSDTAREDTRACIQAIPMDPGAAGKTANHHFIHNTLAGYQVQEYAQTRVQGSKATRATPASTAAFERSIGYLLAPWNSWFFSQIQPFPNEKLHDDAVDAFSAAYNAITQPSVQIGGGFVVI
jgi:predicted phage terminase large subunit-like protein